MRRRRLSCLYLVLLLLAAADSRAQEPAPTPAEAELDALFEQMIANPADLDLAFRYAERAIALGDYEAAVGALERMLVYDPNLPRVRLELGALYFRLGAYDVARVYLQEALVTPDLPEPVRARVSELLGEIDRQVSRHRFSGSLFAGGRFQTNANAGPSSSQIQLGGVDVILDDAATGESDFNAFAVLSGSYAYDLGTQARDTFEVDGIAYGARYADQDQLDLLVMEIDAGPRFQLGERGLRGTSVRPYLVASVIALDDSVYYTSLGGGLNLRVQATPRLFLEGLYDVRRDNFRRSTDQPTADDRDATLQSGLATARFAFTPRLVGETSVGIAYNDARARFRSFTDYAAAAALIVTLDAPGGLTEQPWYASLTGGVRRTNYSGPDPTISPDETRRDDEWRVGASLTVGLTEALGLVTRIDYRNVDSNVELYGFDNLAVSLGLLWRF